MLNAEEILAANEASKRGGNIVFCVGSVLRGDDAAGALLAKKLEDFPVEGWTAARLLRTIWVICGALRRGDFCWWMRRPWALSPALSAAFRPRTWPRSRS